MIDFSAFSDELVKIAEELAFRKAHGVELAEGIPLVRRLSQAPEKAREQLLRATKRPGTRKILGYANVAVHEDMMPSMEEMGFKKMRVATPLPGERFFSTTWRSGKLHAHKQGPFFLLHQDKHDPLAEGRYVSVKGIKHGLKEGVPSVIRRLGERQALVKGAA